MLTQWLRLPVPGTEQINMAAAKLQDYEKSGASQMLRVPIIGKIPLVKNIAQTNSKQELGPSEVGAKKYPYDD